MTTTIKLPSIGDIDAAEVIEIMVSPGDSLEQESPILALETDKAAMEIPSPEAGTVGEVLVKVGDKLSEGDALLTLEVSDQNGDASETQAENKPEDERPPQAPQESEPTNTQEPPPEV